MKREPNQSSSCPLSNTTWRAPDSDSQKPEPDIVQTDASVAPLPDIGRILYHAQR